jgi:hypothetical protein
MKRCCSILFPLAALALTALGGCTGNDQRDEVLMDLTPNLDTLHQRPEDMTNALVLQFDENGRMFWADLGRATYVDRPSRLTREPVWRP